MKFLLSLLTALLCLLPAADAQEPGYRIGPGDVLEVRIYNEADLSGSYTVGPKGSVDIPLVGAITAAGETAETVSMNLKKRLAQDFLVDPQVTISIKTYSSKPVQVLGAIREPGTFHLTGPTNLLDMLAQAGGVVTEKSSQEVRISRSQDSDPIVVNLERLLTNGHGNLPLRAGDVIYVSEGEFIYVSGQVNKPGAVLFREGLTVSQALTACGGPTQIANMRKGYMLRDGEKTLINFRRIIRGRDPDVAVRAGDQVFVDESVF